MLSAQHFYGACLLVAALAFHGHAARELRPAPSTEDVDAVSARKVPCAGGASSEPGLTATKLPSKWSLRDDPTCEFRPKALDDEDSELAAQVEAEAVPPAPPPPSWNGTNEVLEPPVLPSLHADIRPIGGSAQLALEDWACSSDATHEITRLCLVAAMTAVFCKISVSFERNLMSANAILHQVL
uniref:Uncharacterized protein n=1 Tax=Alexandrium andersonii TaxID=327968 RepID=A0A7S2NCY9_9DINO